MGFIDFPAFHDPLSSQDPVMPDFDGTLLTVLTGTCLALLIVVLALVIRISSRIGRLEGQLRQGPSGADPIDWKPTSAESSAGGAFELFLNEDPTRGELPKREQFTAYRKWRQQNGMNWSNS